LVARLELADVSCVARKGRIRLRDDAVDAAEEREVVDVLAAEHHLERVEDAGEQATPCCFTRMRSTSTFSCGTLARKLPNSARIPAAALRQP
jgi:hypothetical protein